MKNKKIALFGIASLITCAAVTFTIVGTRNSFMKDQAGSNEYTLTLDSSNAYTSGNAQNIEIDNGGWNVNFSYKSCSSSSGNHALMSDGGSITNVGHILSVTNLNVEFTGGTLKYRTSLDAETWGSYVTLANGSNDITGNPYYVELKATGAVTLKKAIYTYSCQVNPNVKQYFNKVTSTDDVTNGKYLIVYESDKKAFDGSLTSLDAVNNYVSVNIASSKIEATSALEKSIFTFLKSGSKYKIQSQSGYYIGRSSNSNGLESSKTEAFYNNVSISAGNAVIESEGGATLKFNSNSNQNRFRYYSSGQKAVQLYKLSGSSEEITEVGFTAVDNNASTYTTNSIFDNDNGLEVNVKYSDGSIQQISDGYTYKIYDSSNNEIVTSNKFPAAGNYTLVVSYSSFNNINIPLTVSSAPEIVNYTLVTDASTLVAGDKIVIANYDEGKVAGALSSQILSSLSATFSSNHKEITSLPDDANIFTLGGTSGAWTLTNQSGQKLGATAVKKLAYDDGTTTWDISISGEDAEITNTEDSYGTFLYNTSSPRFTTYTSAPTASMLLPQIYRIAGTPVYPTSISLSGENEVSVGAKTTLNVTYVPSNTNKKTVVWESDNEAIATVNNGVVAGVGIGNTTISAKALKEDSSYTTKASWNITVTEQHIYDYSILVYMCGSDLESGSGAASDDITEMLSVELTKDVAIAIETGGSTSWKAHDINPDYLERYHIENQELKLDEQLEKAGMGETATFQSFLEWGLNTYPAEQTGVILWNHGGAMSGCCFDEFTNDYLSPAELRAGLNGAFTSLGITEKLDWIGYDCCLMQVADIATTNADYFDYMIASQESEWGDGWAYDDWLPAIENNVNITPDQLLPVICDTFVTFYNKYGVSKNDQTLSVLDLSKVGAFISAFDTYATNLGITSEDGFTKIMTAYNSSLRFGVDDDGEYTFGVADMKDFLAKMKTQFSSVDKTALENALKDLVIYNKYGGYYSSTLPCGLCVVAVVGSDTYYWGTKAMYPEESTKLTVWRNININYSPEFDE